MNGSRTFVLAEVVDTKELPVTYPSCPQCCSKVYTCQQNPLWYAKTCLLTILEFKQILCQFLFSVILFCIPVTFVQSVKSDY